MGNISLIVRPQGASSGGEIRDIEGEGTIDTTAEAEQALRHLTGPNANSVVVIGGETYDRTRLEVIRNGGAAAVRPPQEGGSATSGSVRIGTIRPLQAMSTAPGASQIPAGSRLYVYLDGRPVGDGISLNTETPTEIRIPTSAVPDNRAYAVEYRFSRPGMPQLRLNEVLNVHPRMATLSDVRVGPPTTGHGPAVSRFMRDPIRLTFRTTHASEHRVRVAVGGHIEEVTVPAGTIATPATTRETSVALSGQPGAWTDIGGTGRRRTVNVTVTPLGPNGTTGTPVNAGNVVITTFRAPRNRQQTVVVPAASAPAAAPATAPAASPAPATAPTPRAPVAAPPSTS